MRLIWLGLVELRLAGDGTIDEIQFSVSGIITLTSALPQVQNAGPLLIDGNNAITISGNEQVRIFSVASMADLTLRNLVVQNGFAVGDHGGGLYNAGTVTIDHTIFTGNRAISGGGLHNDLGQVTIVDSLFATNMATGGGGLANNSGKVVVVSSTFFSNTAETGGGLNNSCGSMDIDDLCATIIISTSNILSNTALLSAGGIRNIQGAVVLLGSTLAYNRANTSGGGLSTTLGRITITNSTVSANGADRFFGGGLLVHGAVDILNSTLANNYALGEGGNIYRYPESVGLLSIRNSIVADAARGGECSGTIVDQGYNLDSSSSCGFATENGSQNNEDPQLAPLGENGGPTLTHALRSNSPAQNQAEPAVCPATDQRGASRLDRCDVGAYEYGGSIIALSSSVMQAYVDDSITLTATVSVGEPDVPTGTVTFTTTSSVIGTSVLDISGRAIFTTNQLPAGAHNITALYAGDTNYAGSVSPSITLLVNKIPTISTITATMPEPIMAGQPLTVTFATTTALPGRGTPTGTVTVTVSSASNSCTDSLTNGSGACQLILTDPGLYTLTSTYSGDDKFAPSSSMNSYTVIPGRIYLPLIQAQ